MQTLVFGLWGYEGLQKKEDAIAWPENVSGRVKGYHEFKVEGMEKLTTEF